MYFEKGGLNSVLESPVHIYPGWTIVIIICHVYFSLQTLRTDISIHWVAMLLLFRNSSILNFGLIEDIRVFHSPFSECRSIVSN